MHTFREYYVNINYSTETCSRSVRLRDPFLVDSLTLVLPFFTTYRSFRPRTSLGLLLFYL